MRFYVLEKIVETIEVFIPRPQQVVLRFREFSDRFVNRKIKLVSCHDQLLFPFTHFFAFPWGNCIFKYREQPIWNHEIGIYSDHAAKSFACFAGTNRIVEAEEMNVRFLEQYSIRFKAI